MPPIRVMKPPNATRWVAASMTSRPWFEFAPGFHGRSAFVTVSIAATWWRVTHMSSWLGWQPGPAMLKCPPT